MNCMPHFSRPALPPRRSATGRKLPAWCVFLSLLLGLPAALAGPCDSIDRALPAARKALFAPAVERHLNRQQGPLIDQKILIAPSDILNVFRSGDWHIVHVDNHFTDEPFLFYRRSPEHSEAYSLVWAGAARQDEAPATQAWVEKWMPGIPRPLASCFAWYVSRGRTR